MLARLVVLPEPVGPVTSSRPRGRMMSRRIDLGHAQLLEGQELARNAPQHHADVATLLENGHAETVAVDELDGEVGAALFLQFLLAAIRRDALHEGKVIVVVQDLRVQGTQTAPLLQSGLAADRDEQVAGIGLDDSVQ